MRDQPKKTVVIIAIAIVAFLALIFLISYNQPVSLSVSEPIGANIRYAQATSSHTVEFFSGSAFASIDTRTQNTKALSRFYRLPNVSTVKWVQGGALFQANDYNDVDELYSILTLNKLDTSMSYWWYVDFTTGAINLVGANSGVATGTNLVRDVIPSAEVNTYYYLQATKLANSQTANPVLYRATGSQTTTIGPLEATTLLEAKQNLVVYQKDLRLGSALHFYNTETRGDRAVSSNYIGNVVLSGDNKHALIVRSVETSPGNTDVSSDNTAGTLSLVDTDTSAQSKIADSFGGSLVWQDTEWIALQPDGTGYLGTNKKTKQFVLKNLKAGLGKNSACGYFDAQLCLTGDKGILYMAGDSAVSQRPLPSLAKLQRGKLAPDQYSISYDKSRNQIDIYVSGDATANSKEAIKYIKSLGIDPYQVDIRWYANNQQPLG